jgi:PAS domain S-box-containing protein
MGYPASAIQDSSPLLDRFAALLDRAPSMVWIASLDGQCVFVNGRWLEYSGRTLDQELGSGWTQGLHPDDRKACLVSFAAAVAGRLPFEADYRWMRADGTYGLIRTSAIPVAGASGELQAYVGSCSDLTHADGTTGALERASDRQRQLENERDAQIALLTSVVANINDAVVIESHDGRVLLANDAFCRLFAIDGPAHALAGAEVMRLTDGLGLPAGRLDELRRARRHAIDEAMPLANGRVLELQYAPMDVENSSARHLWQCRDITARKHVEAELHTSRQRLRDLGAREDSVREEERRRVAHMLHDELGQLLTSTKLELIPTVGLFRATAGSKDMHIADRLQAVAGLVDVAIETVQRVSAELRPATLAQLGIAEAVRYEALLFEQRTKIRCRVSVTPARFQIDPERASAVYRILVEALINVSRHAGAGAVQISLKRTAGAVVLTVRDNGRGIAPEEIDHPTTMGLLGMRERALAVGGHVRIANGGRRGGTVVSATVPLTTQTRGDTEGSGNVSA